VWASTFFSLSASQGRRERKMFSLSALERERENIFGCGADLLFRGYVPASPL